MCQIYDVRNRPWYVAASSGRKNVVIILDISGSMNAADAGTQTRLKAAQDAVIQVINALGYMDYVGIVTFSTTASAYKPQLIQATKQNIADLVVYIQSFQATGTTNYYDAFDQAFRILESSFTSEISNWQTTTTTIQFMTDGAITSGGTADEVYSLITTRNQFQCQIFTYSIGMEALDAVPQSISCQNQGIYTKVQGGDDLNQILINYYKVLASAIQEPKPIYVEIFQDASGLGKMSAIAMAVFDRTQTPPIFLGVVGMDLLVDKLESYQGYDKLLDLLIAKNKLNGKISLTDCQLENWRSTIGKCGVQNCVAQEEIQKCPQNFKDWPFCGDAGALKQTGSYFVECCQLSKLAIFSFILLISQIIMN